MLQKTEFIWKNGSLIPWDQALVHVLTHTLHYSGGAFEGIRCYKTKQGSAIFSLEQHVDRLIYSAKALKMDLPYNKQQITDAIILTVKENKLEEGYIRPLVYYGYGKMGINPLGSPVEMIIACWPWGSYHSKNFLDIKTSNLIRIHPNSSIIDAKFCGHYLNSMLALLEIRGTHYHEVLLLDYNGHVAEGSAVNFFMVKDGKILTPKLGDILPGITRAFTLELANSLGYATEEADITVEQARNADEAFFTGTAAEVTPIRSIDDKLLSQDKVGPITSKLKDAYLAVVHGENEKYLSLHTQIPFKG